jgi:hypothetical protein
MQGVILLSVVTQRVVTLIVIMISLVILSVVKLVVVILSVVIQDAFMLSFVILSVVMLIVMRRNQLQFLLPGCSIVPRYVLQILFSEQSHIY